MGVNISCVEKFDPSSGRCKMGQREKDFLNIHLTALGNVHEVCKKALLLHCEGQELQDGFSKLLMNSV